jgi:hypothetical protein
MAVPPSLSIFIIFVFYCASSPGVRRALRGGKSQALAIGLAKISAKIRKKTQQPDAAEIADIGKRKPKKVKQMHLPSPIKRSPSDLPRPAGRKEAKQKKGVTTSQNIPWLLL